MTALPAFYEETVQLILRLPILWVFVMRLEIANIMGGASTAAYFDNPYDSGDIAYLEKVHIFENTSETCRGFVGSNDNVVIVAFRGTNVRLNSPRQVISSGQQWLRNLNISQADCGNGVRVHAGFKEDLSQVYNTIGSLILGHGGQQKPVLFTGHSAGAAIATLAAQSYKLAGLNVRGAYVFASPRVGNKAYAEAFKESGVPLFRIENMDDLVPHLPLTPLAMKAVDFVIDKLAEIIQPAFPNLVPSLAGQFEYVHVGKLFFIDWNGELVYSHTLEEYGEDLVEIALGQVFPIEREELPGNPIPKFAIDALRAAITATSVANQIKQGTFEFFLNHPMTHHLKCIRGLLLT